MTAVLHRRQRSPPIRSHARSPRRGPPRASGPVRPPRPTAGGGPSSAPCSRRSSPSGLVAAHDVLAGSGGVPASAAVSLPAQARAIVVAQPGDTLWSIASAHHGDISITRYVDTLVDLNGGATIQAGQRSCCPDRSRALSGRRDAVRYPDAVHCPSCQADDTKVVDSRLAEEGAAVRRRRQCLSCSYRFTTFERVEEVPLVVVKSDGRTQPFDREKIVFGVRAACKGRSVSEEQIEQLALAVEDELRLGGRRGQLEPNRVWPCSTACACSTRSPTCGSLGLQELRRRLRLPERARAAQQARRAAVGLSARRSPTTGAHPPPEHEALVVDEQVRQLEAGVDVGSAVHGTAGCRRRPAAARS